MLTKDAIRVLDATQSSTTLGDPVFPVNSPHQRVFSVGARIGQGRSLGLARLRGRRSQNHRDEWRGRFLPEMLASCGPRCSKILMWFVMFMNDCGCGVVKRILIENGQPVEFGQPLFILG